MIVAAPLLMALGVAQPLAAQTSGGSKEQDPPYVRQQASEWRYRLQISDEVTKERMNRQSRFGNLFAAAGDGAWNWGDRLRLAGGFGLLADSDRVDLREREAYVRASAASWLDVEAGRRVVKWGTGYAFTPTGVLDPPRDARDPQDRLSQNIGIRMAKVDMYRGATAVSLVAAAPGEPSVASGRAKRLYATRVRSSVRGVEMALVAAFSPEQQPSWGANFTHVIGARFEWHGELLASRRPVSSLLGLQYTPPVGPNLIVEYYRDGNDGRSSVFIRASRVAATPRVAPDVIAIVGLRDGSLALVPTLTWHVSDYVTAYGRGTWFNGPQSGRTDAEVTALSATVGVGLRF